MNCFFSEYNILMTKYVKKREKLKSLEIENSEKTKLIINMEKDYDYLIKTYSLYKNTFVNFAFKYKISKFL